MKRLLVLMLMAVLVVASVGCSNDTTGDNTPAENSEAAPVSSSDNPEDLRGEITIWSWDVALEDLRAKAEVFNETYPNVEFNFEEMGTSQVYSKLTTSLASGIGLPDIVSLEGEQMAKFGTKFPEAFVDLSDVVDTAQFLPLKVSEVTVNGKVMAYPWDAAPAVMFYRADLFEQAGVDADSIKTWDDYIEAGKMIDSKLGIKMLPMAYSRSDTMYRIIMMQQGGFYFDAAGNTTVNSPESIKAMETVKAFYDAGISANDISWDDKMILLKDSKVATIPEAIWMVGSIKDAAPDTSGNWRVMPLPSFGQKAYTGSNGGSCAAIPKATKSKEAAVKFLEFAMTDVEGLVKGFQDYGLYPSYIPAYDADEFSQGIDFFGGQAIYEVANKAAVDMPEVNFTENFAEVLDNMKNAVNQVLVEGNDPTETLESFQKDFVNKFGK